MDVLYFCSLNAAALNRALRAFSSPQLERGKARQSHSRHVLSYLACHRTDEYVCVRLYDRGPASAVHVRSWLCVLIKGLPVPYVRGQCPSPTKRGEATKQNVLQKQQRAKKSSQEASISPASFCTTPQRGNRWAGRP